MMSARKKASARTWAVVLGCVLGGVISAFLPGMQDVDLIEFLPYLLLSAGILLASLVLTVILHEGGHLIFGLLTGYRFVSFSVFGFVVQRGTDGRFCLGHKPMAGMAGQCLLAPPGGIDDPMPVALYNMGGVIVNAAVALACGIGMLLQPSAVAFAVYMLLGLVNLYFALTNGLPLPPALIQNDGGNQRCLKTPEGRRALWVQLSMAAEQVAGKRLRDMPEDWFALSPGADLNNPLICSVAVFRAAQLMDQLKLPEAEQAIRALLNRKTGLLGLHRFLLSCDGAVCELLLGRPGDLLEALNTKQHQQLLQSMPRNPSVLRTRYAIALLREQDIPAANAILADFQRYAPVYPFPQEVAAEKELLRMIQQVQAGRLVFHHKLVRDRIPAIIEASGKACVTRTLDDAAYIAALDGKLREELDEYLADGSPEELADLLEVMHAAAEARGHTFDEVEAIRREKADKRGAFRERVWLESVTSDAPEQ